MNNVVLQQNPKTYAAVNITRVAVDGKEWGLVTSHALQGLN